ncbi:MAG: peptidoglycan DD-metalloendopeptidase family protein [Kiloniellales bacterium]
MAVITLLAACGGVPRYGELIGGKPVNFSARPTPPDPPPIPDRKPATPAGFSLAVASRPLAQPPIQPVVAGGDAAAQQLVGPSSYRVAAGETLHHVADRFGLPLHSLIDANGLLPPYTLLTGQRLEIPRSRPGRLWHEVAAGDTVHAISRRYGVDMAELARLNRIEPPYNILLGQKLVIPGPQAAPDAQGGVQVASLGVPGSAAVQASAEPLDGAEQTGARRSDDAALAVAVPVPRPAPIDTGPVPPPPPLHGGKFLWPVSGTILSDYGPKSGGLHNDGVNIAAPRGTPIRAAENGVVAYVGNELRGFGNLLLIKHSDGWVTAYAHADQILVRRGQTVQRGQVVATVGSSGHVSEPQLHFEVRKGVRTLDPARLLESRIAAAS